ncbi:LptA/OstA family protein, partial [Escherichia coli]|nr:LptA/OstA family protein [Escherichia coli]
QGSDRITSQTADIYLTDRNEIERSEFNGAVSITQPGRKASADYALYNAEKEFVILRGRPARVSDAVQGSSEGGEIQMDLRSNRV